MSTPHARQGEARRDHYAEITNQIIAALKAGTPPWRCDWDKTKTGGPASPQNASTGARYRGINTLVLGMSPLAFMTCDPRWATYKQAAERGWQVRKGERGTPGFFFKRMLKSRPQRRLHRRWPGFGSDTRSVPLLRSYTVFNGSADRRHSRTIVDPGAKRELAWERPRPPTSSCAEQRAVVRTGGDRAFYSRRARISSRFRRSFRFHSPEAFAYASVLTHELAHWTGAEHRSTAT